MLASHVLVTCTFLSAVTPLQYFLTRFLMQIFFSISDVCIKTKKGKKKKKKWGCADNSSCSPKGSLDQASLLISSHKSISAPPAHSPTYRAPLSPEQGHCPRSSWRTQDTKWLSYYHSYWKQQTPAVTHTRLQRCAGSMPLALFFTLPSALAFYLPVPTCPAAYWPQPAWEWSVLGPILLIKEAVTNISSCF